MMIQPMTTPSTIESPSFLSGVNYPIEPPIDQTSMWRRPSVAGGRGMRRVLVVGSSGAGKSVLARRLGNVAQLPVIHLDRYFWRAGWQETPLAEWQAQVTALTAGARWIMDGNYRSTLDIRLATADTVVFLDLPRWLCVAQAVKRRFQYLRTPRPDMAQGCQERPFDPHFPQFVRRIWAYPQRARPQLLTKLAAVQGQQTVIHLTTATAVSQFLADPWHYPAGLQSQPTDVARRVDGSAGAQLAFDEGYSR
jgi:adenylate kinase family enzyme